jgi:putative transcriptional regulator
MSSKAFSAIAEGLGDAIAFAKGDTSKGRVRAPKILDVDVAKLRGSLGLSQREFARGFGVKVGTLRNWEQRRRQPEGPARVLLTLIYQDPQHIIGTMWPEKKRSSPTKAKRSKGGSELR